MTQEQIDDLIALSSPLLDNPLPWNQLTEQQQNAFKTLMPNPSFTEVQRYWIKYWWLPVSELQLENLNSLCPPNTLLSGLKDTNDDLFVSVDLLSDALDNGRLKDLLPILETLPLTYKGEEEWPVLESPEEE